MPQPKDCYFPIIQYYTNQEDIAEYRLEIEPFINIYSFAGLISENKKVIESNTGIEQLEISRHSMNPMEKSLSIWLIAKCKYRQKRLQDFGKLLILIQTLNSLSNKNDESHVIHFPPHLKQAGLSLLSYFSEVVRQKYPDDEVNISIAQDGSDKVELTISAKSGEVLEKVNSTLGKYGRYIVDGEGIEELLPNLLHQKMLEERREQAALIASSDKRFLDLQAEVIKQNTLQLQQYAHLTGSLTQQVGTLIMQVGELTTFNLSTIKSEKKEVNRLIRQIERMSKESINTIDKDLLLQLIGEIEQQDRTVFDHLSDMAKAGTGSAFGKLLYALISGAPPQA